MNAMTSLMDTDEGHGRLSKALLEIDERLCREILQTVFQEPTGGSPKRQNQDLELAKLLKSGAVMKLSEAVGSQSRDFRICRFIQ